MHPKVRFSIRIIALIVILLCVNLLFNRFCNLSNQCQPYYLSYMMPRQQGENLLNVHFKTTTQHEGLTISVEKPSIQTYHNVINKIAYKVINHSDKTIKIKPIYLAEPKSLEKYITRFHCLCSKSVTIKANATIILESVFMIDPKIENDPQYDSFSNGKTDIHIRHIF